MVHTRINERTVNPNPHVNFICALPPPGVAYGSQEDPEAKEMLSALAAQLRPVMKRHGFTVNSFEEYESNKVFLGRNWNNGETIELVLRDGTGRFYPASRLLGVFCHELAHIEHMNHSNAFHVLRRQLSAEVAALQRRGYYGDGYWSAGTRIADSERIPGEGVDSQELPEYTCGGAHAQSRASALPSHGRRRRRRPAGPSLSSGVQTAKQRKAGSRVTSKAAFETAGDGRMLDENSEKGGSGSGFRKQAGRHKRAREERALAAERRLRAAQEKIQDNVEAAAKQREDVEELFDWIVETDEDRLKRMSDIAGAENLKALRDDDCDDVVVVCGPDTALEELPGASSRRRLASKNPDQLFSDEELLGPAREGKHGLPYEDVQGEGPPKKQKNKDRKSGLEEPGRVSSFLASPQGRSLGATNGYTIPLTPSQPASEASGVGTLVSRPNGETWECNACTFVNVFSRDSCEVCERPRRRGKYVSQEGWFCLTCTFENQALEAKCAMCDHPQL